MKFEVRGVVVTPHVPTLAQLTTVRKGRSVDHEAMKTFCQNVLPPDQYKALCKRAPASFAGLGQEILKACGFEATISLLDEGELVGEHMAAYVAQEKKSAQLYPDEDDPRRELLPITATAGDLSIEAILRPVMAAEVDDFRKLNTAEAAKKLCQKITVWGNLDEIESTAPALYIAIAEFALDRAGDFEAKRLGE